MSTRDKIGVITDVKVSDLEGIDDEVRELLEETAKPPFFDPDHMDALASQLLDLHNGKPYDKRYVEMRRVLISSATWYQTRDGRTVGMLPDPVRNSVIKRLAELKEEDEKDVRTLCSALERASETLTSDGHVKDVNSSLDAWRDAVDAAQRFVAEPRRRGRFDLEDLQEADDGAALMCWIELIRRLVLTANLAHDNLAAPALEDGPLDADQLMTLWSALHGCDARFLAGALDIIASHTEPTVTSVRLEDPLEPGDTSWINSCAQLCQDVLEWARRSGVPAGHAEEAFPSWPNPRPRKESAGKRMATGPMLCGSFEKTVADDTTVELPEQFLEGSERVYVSKSDELPGTLVCQSERRHFCVLAQYVSGYQALKTHPEINEEKTDATFSAESIELYGPALATSVTDGSMSLSDCAPSFPAEPGTSVTMLGVDEHFEIMLTEDYERKLEELAPELEALLQSYYEE